MRRLAITSLLFGLGACAPAVPDAPTYEQDVKPILLANCARCHGPVDVVTDCFRVDSYVDLPDPNACDGNGANGVMVYAETIVQRAAVEGDMPPDASLTDRQKDILLAWRDAGFPRGEVVGGQPPTFVFLTPPAGGAEVDQAFVVEYQAGDPDGDPVTFDLGWQIGDRSGAFATGVPGGEGSIEIDTSILPAGDTVLFAVVTGGGESVRVDAPGPLTVAAGRNATPFVTVLAPNGGEVVPMGGETTIRWLADDLDSPDLTVDVVVRSAGGDVAVVTGQATTPGVEDSVAWVADVPLGEDYTVEVTVRDGGAPEGVATDASDATFRVGEISFANDIQPLLSPRCTSGACHDATSPARGLNLLPGAAYDELLNVSSEGCPDYALVDPGLPDQSYLIFKLEGTGPCFVGNRMPRGGAVMSAADIGLIRDWIAAGAPDN